MTELLLRPLPEGTRIFGHGNWTPFVTDAAYLSDAPQTKSYLLSRSDLIDEIAAELKSPQVGRRRQAACVLRALDERPELVLKPLSELALNDEDHTVQYFACAALSDVTGVGHACTGNYQMNEESFVNFWRLWLSYKDTSGSPLVVPMLNDPRSGFNYTANLDRAYAPSDLANLIDEADLIVTGTVEPERMANGYDRFGRITVDRVLKNPRGLDTHDLRVLIMYGATRDRGVFLLKQQPEGIYQSCGGAFLKALPAGDGRRLIGEQTPITAVAGELLAVLATPENSVEPGSRISTHSAPKRELDCSDVSAAYAEAADGLKALRSPTLASQLRYLLRTAELPDACNLWIANVLVSFGDYSALNDVKSILMKGGELPESVDTAVRALAQTIACGSSDEQSITGSSSLKERIAAMAELMHSPRVTVRRAAAGNLDLIPCDEAYANSIVEALGKIGLYDPDMEVRYHSVDGLEDLAGSLLNCHHHRYHCSQEEFEKDQSFYVARMRQWVALRPLEFPLQRNRAPLPSQPESTEETPWALFLVSALTAICTYAMILRLRG